MTGLPIRDTPQATLEAWAPRLVRPIQYSERNGKFVQEERETGETWINEQPIFRKVVNIGTLPNNTSKFVPHGVRYTRFLSMKGYAFGPTNGISINIPHPDANTLAGTVELAVAGANIVITTTGNLTAFSESYVVLEYIKS